MKVVWRPSIELVVTIPFLLDQDDIESPMVTSLVASYAMSQGGAAGEEIASIGGRVIDPAGDGLAGAWVQVRGVAPPALLPVSRWTIRNLMARSSSMGCRWANTICGHRHRF